MKVTLIKHSPTSELGDMAGICYDRYGNNDRRLKHIIDHGHLAVLRFGCATFNIEGISRVALAQFTRSKHLDYLVRSSRHCDESQADFYEPPSLAKVPYSLIHEWAELNQRARELYGRALDCGMSKEDARYILPQAQTTSLNVHGNYQAWVDFIRLRCNKATQYETRAIAYEIQRQLIEVAPLIFEVML